MKFVFMGTPDFSVGILEKLIEAGNECTMVVTQPDKPKGRGYSMQFSPVKEAAVKAGIEVLQPVKIREPEFVEQLRKVQADVFVVAAFGQILTKEILEMPKFGCVNVHASLLPKYRGASPIQWAVINGEKVSGVCTMKMNEGLDTGDIIKSCEIELDAEETGGSLFDRLAVAGANLAVETLKSLEDGTATYTKQDDSMATYTGKIDKLFGKINWNSDAKSIERLIRGLNPWPSAYTSVNGKMLKIWKANVIDSKCNDLPGKVAGVNKNSFTVACKDSVLEVLEVQLEGKKRMDAGSFLRGYSLDTETVLGE